MHSFITGIDGFIGSHLTQALLAGGDTISGLSYNKARADKNVTVYQADITDAEAVTAAIAKAAPDRIFHLAAQSNITRSLEQPRETFDVNINGSINLFEAVRAHAPDAVVISVGSSAEYGGSGHDQDTIDEQISLSPSSPYAVSKASQGLLVTLYCRAYRMRIIHVRPFAVIGPGKQGDAVSDFCRAVVRIEAGGDQVLRAGNLDVVRDFIDVRDCVGALRLVAEHGVVGETYNICNGSAASLQQIVQQLQQLANKPFQVVKDPTRLRPVDDRRLVGSNVKLRQLGYQHQYDLEATVRSILDYWRVREGQRKTEDYAVSW